MSFLQTIEEWDGGALASQLDEAMRDMAAAVVENQGPGKITLVISMKPNAENQAVMEAKVNVAAPRGRVGLRMVFVDGEGELHRRDPRQTDIADFLDKSKRNTTNNPTKEEGK